MLQKLFIDQADAKRIARDAGQLLENGDAPFNPRKMPKSTRPLSCTRMPTLSKRGARTYRTSNAIV
jgi:hypothetical protein